MKRLFFAAILIVSGCSKIDSRGRVKDSASSQTINIEGCEYLVVENSATWANNYSFAITHKGNCVNPIHRSPDEGKKAK